MLARKSYPEEYIDATRAQVEAQIASFEALAAAVPADSDASSALADFEPRYCRSMILVLEGLFVHRLRGAEGKDGNPVNEVRVVATSIAEHDCVLEIEAGIKLRADRSVLGLAEGDPIVLGIADLRRLATAYFTTIEDLYAE